VIHANGEGMPDKIVNEFRKLYDAFVKIWGISPEKDEPLFLMRFCFADEPKIKSLRLDLEDIYQNK
jgi:hypothetical protein